MSNKVIITIVVALVVIIGGSFAVYNMNKSGDNMSGGDKIAEQQDQKGCVGAAGYVYNETINACIRRWQILPDMQIAAKLAVEHVGWSDGITVLNVLTTEEPGNFIVKLQKGDELLNVYLNAEEVTKVEPTPQDVPLSSVTGAEEMVKEVFIQIIGVDRELMNKTNPANVIWNDGTEDITYSGRGLAFSGALGSEQVYSFFTDIVDTMQLLGFITNEANVVEGDDTFRALRMFRSDMTCTLIVEDQAEVELSQIEFRCANIE